MHKLTKGSEQQLRSQHPGTGVLMLKVSATTILSVEVFIRPRDGVLCRIFDGQPALPIEIDYTEEEM